MDYNFSQKNTSATFITIYNSKLKSKLINEFWPALLKTILPLSLFKHLFKRYSISKLLNKLLLLDATYKEFLLKVLFLFF